MSVEKILSAPILGALRDVGWARIACGSHDENELAANTLELAEQLGTPVQGRVRGLVEPLRPRSSECAPMASLSRTYGLNSFPFHIDTAHWTVPARYLILSCADPGEFAARTLLVCKDVVPISVEERTILKSALFFVRNGRKSFYSTILGLNRDFIRFDPGCMEPLSLEAVQALELFSPRRIRQFAQLIDWESGDSLVIDNWRTLHAREAVDGQSSKRLLLRCLVL